MIWLFAAVVLILAVYHAQFRKVLLWTVGGAAALVIFALVAMTAPHYDRQPVERGATDAAWCTSASSSSADARTAALVSEACSSP